MPWSAEAWKRKFLSLPPSQLALCLFCLGFGGGAIWIARDYPYGTLTSMGPGFVPTAVATLLVVLGLLIGLGGAAEPVDEPDETTEAVPRTGMEVLFSTGRVMFFILGAVVLFGSIIRSVGLAISVFVLVVLASYARQHVRLIPTLVFASAVTVGTCVLFVTLLGLETPILPRF
jgi:hypothetical protein